MGSGGKKQTAGYKYYLGMDLRICHGDIDAVTKIFADGKLIAEPARYNQGDPLRRDQGVVSTTINMIDVFGGSDREGGISGVVDIQPGSTDQTQNAYLQSQLGPNIPASRGVAGMILNQCYLGNSPYIKPWAAETKRISKTSAGDEQWYIDKAAIGESYLGHDYTAASSGGVSADVNATMPFDGAVEIYISQYLEDGGVTVNGDSVDRELVSGVFWNRRDGEWHLERTYGYIATVQADKGDTVSVHAYASGASNTWIWATVVARADNVDMNPAHIVRECFTDQTWGMGYSESDVDDTLFAAAADTLYDEGMGMSMTWDASSTIESFVGEVLRHIDASRTIDRSTGKIGLKLIRDDYDVEELVHLYESNSVSVDASKSNYSERVNSVTVKYWDARTDTTASVTVSDPALVQMQGSVINTTVDYPGFTSQALAARAAARDLRSLSSSTWSGSITTGSAAKGLNIGDPFLLSWSDYGITSVVMRVKGMSFGDGKDNSIKIDFVQDVFDLPSSAVVSSDTDEFQGIDSAPAAVYPRLVTESPYYEVVQAIGQTTTDDELAANEDLGYLIAAGGRPATGAAINARMYVDPDTGTYTDAETIVDFAPFASLDGDITKVQTVVQISGGSDIDEVVIGTHAQVGDEIVRVDDISSTSMTIGRGVLDTVPAEHSDGAPVLFWDLFPETDGVQYASGEEISAKLLTVTTTEQLDIDDAPEDAVTMNSRAIRPYPPGNFKISGKYFPDEVVLGDVEITWAHRDRKQQTSSELFDFADGDIGPEDGTTYTVVVKDDVGTELHTEAGITGTAWTYTEAALNADTSYDVPPRLHVELWSARDGYASMQKHEHSFDLVVDFNLTATPSEEYNLTKGVIGG